MDDIRFILKQKGCVVEGDIIINIASMPIASKGMSNMMKMSVV
jgi:pyruvate kinase